MNQQFYKQFNSDNKKIVAVFGDRLRTLLINILAGESINSGCYALILGDAPMSYPIEGKVLVCDDLSIVNKLIDQDNPKPIYLASKVKNDLLHPFSKKNINQLASNINDNIIIYIDIDSKSKINLKTSPFLKEALLICSVNFNLLEENLPQISKIKELKNKSIDKQVSDKVYSIITKMCPQFVSMDQVKDKICFIDQVKGLFDENVIISIARNLKSRLNCKMLIGNSNTCQIKAI